MRFVFCLIILFVQFICTGQELVENGNAEQPLWVGWKPVNTSDYWIPANQRPAHGGLYHFYPQNTVANTSELFQNIDLSASSVGIDAGTISFTFSGWRRGFNNVSPFSGDLDRAQIIVEYRDASGTVLSFFDTGSAVLNTWTNSTDTRYPPVGTRSVRIRLISVRVSGSDNDGYYDDISLIQNNPCAPPANVTLTPNIPRSYCLGSSFTITGIASPANSNYFYTWYKNGSPITTASKTYTSIIKSTSVASDAGTYTLRVEDGNTGTATCYKESSVTITFDQPVIAGTISSNSETCNNTTPAPFTGTASTGGTAVKYYKWQYSIGPASNPWVDVQAFNTTATGYTPTTPVQLMGYYRRIDSSGSCANVPTNTITIRTRTKHPLSPIISLVRDTLCIGENFQLNGSISGPPIFSINGGFYFTWKKVQGTTTIPMSINPTVARPATLADSGTYYFIVQDGLTATSQCKDSVKIVIRINQAPTQKALIQNNQEFCLGTSAAQLTELRPATGGTGIPVYHQWYSTADTTGVPALSKIPGSTSTDYNPGSPLATTYYVRTDSVKYCPAVKTNFTKIRVNNKPILDSIRATVNDTLCENFGNQFQLKGYIDSITTGKQSINGGFYFTWKKLQQPATTAVVVRATGKYTDYPAISRPVVENDSGTYYLIVQDGINTKKCLDSIAFKIVVSKTCVAVNCSKPDFVSIKVSAASNTTLCAGSRLVLQKDVITLPATPPTVGYVYSWIRTNALGTVLVKAASSTYQDLIIGSVSQADSGRYQLIVQDGISSPTSCAEISLPISIDVQNPITQSYIGSNDTTVCIGYPTALLPETLPNTGGTGIYIHQWEFSIDEGLTFTEISGATNTSYQAPSVWSKTFFRRIDKSGVCPSSTSREIVVYVGPEVQPGTISPEHTTACPNTNTSIRIKGILNISGGTGTNPDSFQWQKSIDNTVWTNIPNTNTYDYTETNPLSETTYYRRCVSRGIGSCDNACTPSVSINVPVLTTGSIGSDQSICSNTFVAVKEITGATGNNIFYQWIQSADYGATWIKALGNSSFNNYSTPILYDTMWYRRVVISSCEQDSSNIVKINVIQTPSVSAGNDLTIQQNSVITLRGKVTGSTNYSWTPSTNLNNPNILQPDATITNTTTYTLSAWDATGTCNAQNSVTINVKHPILIPNVITPNGDGINDTWNIEHIEDYPNATFVVYNRWGNIVWKASINSFEWNGTNYRNGEVLPDGTYFYIIDLKSIADDAPLTGYVQIIK